MPENNTSLAVVGFSGKFPGAKNVNDFWQNLINGTESITVSQNSEAGWISSFGVLGDVEYFDAQFFEISSYEAARIDPQHRFFLEACWQCLELAGYNPDLYSGRIGVYGTSGANSYLINNLLPNIKNEKEKLGYILDLGNRPDFLTTRVSYKLNLTGPSISVYTACSSSLVSVCLACTDLLSYQTDMAIAGGFSIMLPQNRGYRCIEGMLYSPTGRCRPFDIRADGTVPGNGGGVVLIKRLEDAIEDRDTVYAVIKGFATNNDGKNKVNYMAPGARGQAEVIKASLDFARFPVETIDYIEAHGTGTNLGDPIEIDTLNKIFSGKGSAIIGSLKANIGHLLESSGIAGLIKVILMLYYKKIPPQINFEKPNPKLRIEKTPFSIKTSLQAWKKQNHPRRAIISSFGIGGTNSHLSLEEFSAPSSKIQPSSKKPQLILLSAKTTASMKKIKKNLSDFIANNPKVSIRDLAFTLQIGRKNLELCEMYQVLSAKELKSKLLATKKTTLKSITDKKLRYFCERWLKGESVDWTSLHKNQSKNRIPLPTYPFERKKAWIDASAQDLPRTNLHLPKYDDIKHKLLTIARDLFGNQNIEETDQLNDISLDSLSIVHYISAIQTQFHLEISLEKYVEYPTIKDLAMFIYEQDRFKKESNNGMVLIKEGTGKTALVQIHPIEGQIICYQELAKHIQFDGPIYGIYSNSNDNQGNQTNINELATRYINLIKEKGITQLVLLGYSFGAFVAYQMASDLLSSSIKIKKVILIEGKNPQGKILPISHQNTNLKNLIQLLTGKNVANTSCAEVLFKKLLKILGYENLTTSQQESVIQLIIYHLEALRTYKPKPIKIDAICIFSKNDSDYHKEKKFWKALIGGNLIFKTINTTHTEILKKPHVKNLAKIINDHL